MSSRCSDLAPRIMCAPSHWRVRPSLQRSRSLPSLRLIWRMARINLAMCKIVVWKGRCQRLLIQIDRIIYSWNWASSRTQVTTKEPKRQAYLTWRQVSGKSHRSRSTGPLGRPEASIVKRTRQSKARAPKPIKLPPIIIMHNNHQSLASLWWHHGAVAAKQVCFRVVVSIWAALAVDTRVGPTMVHLHALRAPTNNYPILFEINTIPECR